MSEALKTTDPKESEVSLSRRAELAAQDKDFMTSEAGFALCQRIAACWSSSQIIPKDFQGNIPNCVVALEMASRMRISILAVMQHMYMVHGKPGWSSQFIIAAVNSTGKFSPVRFELTGNGDERQCIAWAKDLESGDRLESPAVSIKMAKQEGWMDKNGSKWKTMPELMLRYRAATFFGRLYAPDVLMGMRAAEEMEDTEEQPKPPVGRIEFRTALPPTSLPLTNGNGNGHTEVEVEAEEAKQPNPGNETAGPDLFNEIAGEVQRTGLLTDRVVAMANECGAAKYKNLTIFQAERMVAELRRLPNKPEATTVRKTARTI